MNEKKIYHVCSECDHVLDEETGEEFCPDHPDAQVDSILADSERK